MYMEEVAYIGGKYKPLSKNKINDIILNGESLIKNKVVDLTNVIGSGGGNVDLSDYVTKVGTDTITINTSEIDGSGLIVQYGNGIGTPSGITTTNITPQGFITSFKQGSTDYNAVYTMIGMQFSTGTNTAMFNASTLQYVTGDKQGSINYADILTSASLDNYAKLDANNTFTGTNTFNSNLISQVIDVNTVDVNNFGYQCTVETDEAVLKGIMNSIGLAIEQTVNEYPNYPNFINCAITDYPLIRITESDVEHSVKYSLDISTRGIELTKSTTGHSLIALSRDTASDECQIAINNSDTTTGIRFFSKYIKFNNNTTLNYSDIATKVTTTESSDTAITLKPNANVDITPTAATAITIAKPTDTTMVNIYSCTVNTKTSSEVTIALADTTATITWDDTPSFEAGKLYEISVRYTPSGYFGLIHSWSL